jgi:hypothetical protein
MPLFGCSHEKTVFYIRLSRDVEKESMAFSFNYKGLSSPFTGFLIPAARYMLVVVV